jgi:hypothetical protein
MSSPDLGVGDVDVWSPVRFMIFSKTVWFSIQALNILRAVESI